MARKSSRGRGQKRQVDWVVNDETYGSAILLPNGAQVGLALTVPQFIQSFVDPTLSVTQPAYSMPEQDSGQVAYSVKGHVSLSPGTWAAGSVFRLMMRIVKKPMEYASVLQMVTDPNYSLFRAEFANERFIWQRYLRESFNLGGSHIETLTVNWSGVCKLDPDEALWFIIENQSGITQDVNINPFLRTLMRAN